MNDDFSHLPELTAQDWIPVPDEGWTPSAATAGNPHVCMLNGTWDFAIAPRDRARGWRDLDGRWWRWSEQRQALEPHATDRARGLDATFMRAEPGEGDWQPITVPGHWELEGFSRPVFAHASLDRDDVVGYYRRSFETPAAWRAGGRVILQAEGIAASAEIWINERFAGYHDGGFVPFQLDVTALLNGGANLLAIRVQKADLSTVHDNAGQWMLSGIWRDLFLFRVGEAHVTDWAIEADFDPASREGRLGIDLSASAQAAEVEAVLWPPAGERPIASARAAVRNGAARVEIARRDLAPWTPETPHMYRLECRLIVAGEMVERVREEVGFRRFEAAGERFLLNGEPFTIRGVTRHEIKAGRGRALSLADFEHEIRLMRRANVNGVRSHPYPFDPRFIKLCARHGLLVCSGFCLCGYNSWGNPWPLSETPTYPAHESTFDAGYRHLFQQRYRAFAPRIHARLRNCAAIFAWSLSNESAISEIFYPVARFLHEREQHRFIISAGESNMMESKFYSAAPQQQPLVEHIRRDLLTADAEHYPERRTIDELRQRIPLISDRPRPVFYTEAAHVFCNRDHFLMDPGILGDTWGRGLKRYFEAACALDGVGGYFVFEWSDQGVMQKGDPALDASFLAPWRGYKTCVQNIKGVLGPNHEPKPAYHSLRKAFAPVTFDREPPRPGEPIRVRIGNRMVFRDLAALCWTEVRVGADGSCARSPLTVAAAPGRAADLSLAALGAGESHVRIEVREEAGAEPIAEHEIAPDPRPWPGERAEPVATRWRAAAGPPAGLAGDRALAFLGPIQPVWGLADPRRAQRDLGMGHVCAEALPANVIGPGDIERVETLCDEAGRRRTRHHLRDGRGHLECDWRWSEKDGAAVIEQELARHGEPVWFTGAGLLFALPGTYDRLSWRRRGGVWNEYPEDHPDRLTGEAELDRDEYPPVNPFRWPPWSALLHVRDTERALVTGLREPDLRLVAGHPGQRLAVRTRRDGARDMLLLFEAGCNLPWHEFSFFRGEAAREAVMGVHPIRPGAPWRQSWRLALAERGGTGD